MTVIARENSYGIKADYKALSDQKTRWRGEVSDVPVSETLRLVVTGDATDEQSRIISWFLKHNKAEK